MSEMTPTVDTETQATEATPEASTKPDKEKVQQVLNLVRPYLQNDGGDCELVNITDEGVVELRLHGACGTCPSSTYTLKMGIEEQLKQYVPGVTSVVSVE